MSFSEFIQLSRRSPHLISILCMCEGEAESSHKKKTHRQFICPRISCNVKHYITISSVIILMIFPVSFPSQHHFL